MNIVKTKKNLYKYGLKNGISLIALIIIIIIIIILIGIIISNLKTTSVIATAREAKLLNNISCIKEGIELYKTTNSLNCSNNLDLYPLVKDENNNYITMNDVSDKQKQKFAYNLKYLLYKTEKQEEDIQIIPDVENIDYTKFYKLDNNLINLPNVYDNDLYIYINKNNYVVFNINGVKYKDNIEYSIIPLGSVINSEYIALTNNSFKLYGDGTLKVLGQINYITGQTSEEENEYAGLKDFIYPEQIPDSQNVIKTYFSCGTAYVIDKNNDLWAWGNNLNNKLGQGYSYTVTVPIKINEGIKINDQQIKVKNVWAGEANTWILDTENRIWACGSNTDGCLGQGNSDVIYKNYINVTQIDGSKVQEIYPSLGDRYTLVKYTDGTVYGCGGNYNGILGTGNYNSSSNFMKLDSYTNAKKILSGLITTYVLKENGELYGCGYNGYGNLVTNGNLRYNKFVKIADNVEDVSYNDFVEASILYKTTDGEVYCSCLYRLDGNGNRVYDVPYKMVENLNDSNLIIDTGGLIYSKGKMYFTNYNIETDKLTLVSYCSSISDVYEKMNFPSMVVFKSNNTYYMSDYPDITRIGKRIRTSLKEVFKNATFLQGIQDSISIVDKDTNIWESLTYKNPQLTNVKKIISSPTAKYVLLNTGELYAKGDIYTGCWGDISRKDDYVKVTKNGTDQFSNVKDIYTSANGDSLIFITKDNEIYWSGRDSKIYFPGEVKGDIAIFNSNDTITKYPHKIDINKTLSSIVNNIKDICYNSYWTQETYSKSTYILTNDGDLYSMGDSINTTRIWI